MTVEISAALAAGRLNGTAAVLNAVAPGASVLFYAATATSAFGETPAEPHLVAVPLTNPLGTVGDPAPDLGITPAPLAVLTLIVEPAPEGQVSTTGTIAWARILDGAGAEHIRCPVGAEGSGAPIEVEALAVYAGGYVRIVSGVFY
ncbi:MAG: hypothetical protein ROZ37_01620 [Aromatoleum sp.]|jgi:hypothetical protein|uniref:hypothetical protein n=1 Tax=Aromatoleum sp. TaxID=2307007 RepID=UPI002894F260|nr:hypothetical protein [Aromatoleum sp.]MDT3669013.1 hypothetical protein [Aromatoleum sp.]